MPQPELQTGSSAPVEQGVYQLDVGLVEPKNAPGCRINAVFPDGAWRDGRAEVLQKRPETAAALEAYAFPPTLDWSDEERGGVRTDGVVIIHGGELIYERYAHGYDVDRPHLAWSVSKTFNAALAGIAVREGRLDPLASI
jgi:CubicO group peptidase (beta-lactamase class C family)